MDGKEAAQRSVDLVADMAENAQLEYTFATPVFRYVLKNVDSLNAQLSEMILERERTKPSMEKSNQGGWQSSPDFFCWGGATVTTLERYLNAAVRIATARVLFPAQFKIDFELFGWGAVNRNGNYNTTHVHPMATWSGVYYVDAGDEPPGSSGAVLEFSHPITASLMTFFPGLLSSARLVRPETGMIILFPSYLQHSVRMYHGSRPRICVPFNAHVRSVENQQGSPERKR
jgi:uncharacterized protein (TIGR02466 family)